MATSNVISPQQVEKHTNAILQRALERRIIDVWNQLTNSERAELERLIQRKGLANAITKLALLKLYDISCYTAVRQMISAESEKTGISESDLICELVRYCRCDVIQASTHPAMKNIQDIAISLLNDILTHR